MVRLAARAPIAVGLKVTLIVQVFTAGGAARLVPQLLVCAKSPAFAPAMAILVIASAAPPVLDSVTV